MIWLDKATIEAIDLDKCAAAVGEETNGLEYC